MDKINITNLLRLVFVAAISVATTIDVQACTNFVAGKDATVDGSTMVTYAADSVKLARQKQRIDSLRHQTKGMPVVVEEDTLFYFYAKRGGLTPQQRAENVSHEITTLGKRFNLHPDSVYIESTDIVTDVMYGDKVIVSFTDQDGLWESCTRD